jgi:hypothetical protein
LSFIDGVLTVTPRGGLTITANDGSKTYGDLYTFGDDFTVNGLVNADAVSSVILASLGAPVDAAVGPYAITASAAAGSGLGNYTISYVNGTLTVNPSPTPPLTEVPFIQDNVVRAYWEILNPYRYVSVDPSYQAQTFYLYHPLREADDSAFRDVNIDADTYEFIQDGIDLKKKLNPYFSSLDDKEEEKSEPAA